MIGCTSLRHSGPPVTAITFSLPFHVPLTLETPELGAFLSLHAAAIAAIAHTTSHRRIASSLRACGGGCGRRTPARAMGNVHKRCQGGGHREQRAGVSYARALLN